MSDRKEVRRWRLVMCYVDKNRNERAANFIKCLEQEGFKAKVWAPLEHHKTSGHIHVVAFCTLNEKVVIGLALPRKYGTRPCPEIPKLLKALKGTRGFMCPRQ